MRSAWISILLLSSCVPRPQAFAWGPEGHHTIVLLAGKYLNPASARRIRDLLGSENLLEAAVWADSYKQDHPDTGPWHYINIPLRHTTIDMQRDCPRGDCVLAKTQEFLAKLQDTQASPAEKAQALKFVIHFVGDLHQPLHAEDDNDRGGNGRLVIFGSHVPPTGLSGNLHWLWDTGLLESINSSDDSLARKIRAQITPQQRAAWAGGSLESWVLEAHRLAQSVAYRGLSDHTPAAITPEYERSSDQAIELQLAKAGVRLAYLLNHDLH